MVDIKVNDIGPITEFESQLGEPGMYVLRGRQQSGKTTILRTVELAVSGRTDEKPSKRDGTRAGTAQVAGKSLRITSRTVETGELSVNGLGDLDVSTIHRPKYKDPIVRDRQRIAALCRLSGAMPKAEDFFELMGGEDAFRAIVGDMPEGDLVDVTGEIKRRIEEFARREENSHIREHSRWSALSAQADGLDLNAAHDDVQLRHELETAISNRAALTAQRDAGLAAIRNADAAKQRMQAMPAVPNIAVCETNLAEAGALFQDAQRKVADLKEQLRQAEIGEIKAHQELAAAQRQLAHARELQQLTAELTNQISAAANVQLPTDSELRAAEDAVVAASAGVERGARIREALRARAVADEHGEAAKKHKNRATKLRVMAGGVHDILSAALSRIPNCPLKVTYDTEGQPRVTLETARSQTELFDELSDGAAWSVIVPMLCAEPGRIIVLPQAAYGEIQPKNRALIHRLFRERGCWLLTAQVDDGDLRCEMYDAVIDQRSQMKTVTGSPRREATPALLDL